MNPDPDVEMVKGNAVEFWDERPEHAEDALTETLLALSRISSRLERARRIEEAARSAYEYIPHRRDKDVDTLQEILRTALEGSE